MSPRLLSTAEVAHRLGVSTRRVQYLARDGTLTRVVPGYVDAASVDHLLAVRGSSHRRAWSEGTAWAAVALLSGVEPTWLGRTQRSRLRARLRDLSAVELVERARNRADVRRFFGHASVHARLRGELAGTMASSSGLGLAEASGVDAHVDAADLDGLVRRFALTEDPSGDIVLRASSIGTDVVADLIRSGDALAALDLAGSIDSRARSVGRRFLDDLLDWFRG